MFYVRREGEPNPYGPPRDNFTRGDRGISLNRNIGTIYVKTMKTKTQIEMIRETQTWLRLLQEDDKNNRRVGLETHYQGRKTRIDWRSGLQ